jgi:hypothetical protein
MILLLRSAALILMRTVRSRGLAAVHARRAERARQRHTDPPRTEHVPGQQALPGMTR